LLGLDGLVLVGHGRSNAKAITSSLILANKANQSNLVQKMREGIADSFK